MSDCSQYKYEEVLAMTFDQLGSITDPTMLMATGCVSPMVIRYVIRTGQLEDRFAHSSLSELLEAVNAAHLVWDGGKPEQQRAWAERLSQQIPIADRNSGVDSYLDEIAPRVRALLRPRQR